MSMDIGSEIKALAKRARTAKYLEAKEEFASNAYPMLEQLFDYFQDRVAQLEEVVYGEASTIQPELASEILGVFALATRFVDAVETAGYPNDLVAKLGGTLQKAIPRIAETVQESTLVDDDDDEEGEEGDDDGEEADTLEEADDTAEEAAKVANDENPEGT